MFLTVLIAQANLDVEGLDETTAMIVNELRAVDPVLRELYVNTSRIDALKESERTSRRMQAEMVQTLKELEWGLSFMMAWTTAEGSEGIAGWHPRELPISTPSVRTVRERLQRVTKDDMTNLKRERGRPGAM